LSPDWGLVDIGGQVLRVRPIEQLMEGPAVGRPLLEPNGSLYLIRRHALLDRRAFVADGDIPMVVESAVEALDIDTSWDWFIAKSAVHARLVPRPDRRFEIRSGGSGS
jgi:CMP-N-acetylneuraminic acid synthetase